MDSLTRGTTRKVKIKLPNELSEQDISSVWLTFKQNRTELFTKTKNDMTFVKTDTETYYLVRLSQSDTLKLSKCGDKAEVNIQARVLTVYDDALASDSEFTAKVKDILKDGEIS